jgi:5-methylthioadenosine/S-adenosylhomocysteine deaminase
MRDRKHLVSAEVEKLLAATKNARNATRDRCFLLLMFRHGLRVAASNNNLDMWQELHLAALLHKGVALDPTTMPATAVLRMATLGGAEAIGLGAQIGAVTVGRQADLIQIRLNRPHLLPLYDVISHLVYAARADDVTTVVVDGKVVMHNRDVRTLDLGTIRTQVRRIARQIAAALLPPGD